MSGFHQLGKIGILLNVGGDSIVSFSVVFDDVEHAVFVQRLDVGMIRISGNPFQTTGSHLLLVQAVSTSAHPNDVFHFQRLSRLIDVHVENDALRFAVNIGNGGGEDSFANQISNVVFKFQVVILEHKLSATSGESGISGIMQTAIHLIK